MTFLYAISQQKPPTCMANGLVPGATHVAKTGVLDDTLEPIILRLIKLQNLSVMVNILQILRSY